MMNSRHFLFAAAALALSITTGCRVSVDKAKNGEDKNVKIDTPLGGLHVRSNDVSAADIGLPVYPGAQVAPDKDGSKSADVHLGFGEWQFHLKVVTYESPDSQDKIVSFYRKALGRYGDVIQCQDKAAIGSPVATREGLGCDDSEPKSQVKVSDGMSLKAGSKRHQHIMAIENNNGAGTRFSLVQLDLPAGSQGGGQQSN